MSKPRFLPALALLVLVGGCGGSQFPVERELPRGTRSPSSTQSRPKINWDNPIAGSTAASFDSARQSGANGVFQPGLGTSTRILVAPGSSDRWVVFVYDLASHGRVLLYEGPPDETPEQFHETNLSLAAGSGKPDTTGSFQIQTIRNGKEALVTVADEGAPTTVTWLESGLEIILRGPTLTMEDALALAEKV